MMIEPRGMPTFRNREEEGSPLKRLREEKPGGWWKWKPSEEKVKRMKEQVLKFQAHLHHGYERCYY